MSDKQKKKCPLCFNSINIGGKCSCGYDDKIKKIPEKRSVIIKQSINKIPVKMNDKQKILIIIAVISIIMFIATAYNFTTVGGNGNAFGAYRATLGEPTYHTNWVGIFSIGIFFGSLLGFFLFKDK